MQLPTIHVDNHYAEVSIGDVDLYFSYRTLIAFRVNGELFARVNDWSATTGKHLNSIQPDKGLRLTSAEFELAVAAYLGKALPLAA